MQLKIRFIASAILLMTVAFVSCKKTDTTPSTTDQNTELAVQSEDQSNFS